MRGKSSPTPPVRTCIGCGTPFSPEWRGTARRRQFSQRRHCSDACRNAAYCIPLAERFWAKVRKTDDLFSCWEWTGHCTRLGYGVVDVHAIPARRKRAAHRVAWELTYGAIPDGLFVCHHCDNPSCQRPDHLFLGTPADNMRDKCEKGRHVSGMQTHPECALRGSAQTASKLTEADIPVIRERCRRGERQKDVAADYQVDRSLIGRIMHGKAWKHIR